MSKHDVCMHVDCACVRLDRQIANYIFAIRY